MTDEMGQGSASFAAALNAIKPGVPYLGRPADVAGLVVAMMAEGERRTAAGVPVMSLFDDMADIVLGKEPSQATPVGPWNGQPLADYLVRLYPRWLPGCAPQGPKKVVSFYLWHQFQEWQDARGLDAGTGRNVEAPRVIEVTALDLVGLPVVQS